MKKLVYEIEKLDHYGRGIARDNGIPVFIENSLPNEKVEVDIINQKKKYLEGKAVKILNKSSDRIEPPCPYYSECGGCNVMHIDYQKQLEFKENKVREVLKKFCNFKNVKDLGINKSFKVTSKTLFL